VGVVILSVLLIIVLMVCLARCNKKEGANISAGTVQMTDYTAHNDAGPQFMSTDLDGIPAFGEPDLQMVRTSTRNACCSLQYDSSFGCNCH
jgi:hypothetical protein